MPTEYNSNIDEILDTLQNPDEPLPPTYNEPSDCQQALLGMLIGDDALLDEGINLVKPYYFEEDAHRQICKALFEYRQKYEQKPEITELRKIIAERFKDHQHKNYFLAELDAAAECYEPTHPKRQFYLDWITDFAKTQAIKQQYSKGIDILKSRKADRFDRFWQSIESAKLVGGNGGYTGWLDVTAPDFADGESTEWIITDFIGRGQTTLFAGPSKAGKSIIMAYLCNQIVKGGSVLGEQCLSHIPILYLDFENVRRYFAAWYMKFNGGYPTADTSRYLNYKTKSLRADGVGSLPAYLTKDWLKREAEKLERDRQYGQPGVIFIDTFRGAFILTPEIDANFENSATAIGQLLRPLQDFSHETGWGVVILHHCNKRGSASGSTEFLAACDSMILHERDIANGSNLNAFTFLGRSEHPVPKRFMELVEDGFAYRGTAEEYQDGIAETSIAKQRYIDAKAIVQHLNEHNWTKRGDIVEMLPRRKASTLALLDEMVSARILAEAKGKANAKLVTTTGDHMARLVQWVKDNGHEQLIAELADES